MEFKNKKTSTTQNYERYWKLTVEYSDINGHQFIDTLKVIVKFIDDHPSLEKKYESKLYQKLQKNINKIFPKSDQASTRKSINQFVKLGFILPKLKGYHDETKKFIKSKNDEERKLIFSEIYYKYASLSSSVTKDKTKIKQINFLLKTLMFKSEKKLTKQEIIGLMTTDISLYKKGYLNSKELFSKKNLSKVIDFESRKYNQINYFMNFLQYVPGIQVKENKSEICYIEDEFDTIKDEVKLSRDQTLFRIMKEKVKAESIEMYGDVVCYLTKKPQKGLVVSHIWPLQYALDSGYIDSAYNPNNALLLEPNIDAYFDKFDITFNKDDGIPKFNDNVHQGFIETHKNMCIEEKLLNKEREGYLDIHNNNFIDKKNYIN
ncbi:HNH endonuclease signature motif containing protein [Halanaerobium praevalens]|uniref:Type II site-specific deoxyribonuclease n=1 Tax=Halanaerobium praevalens (strain ATCC 33744 / DSM 2228 / GSL) TaxID=572479 RepID=E3DM35_HALPG|nr:HNH endonuclease signature motif containing protein [Halanaerobium praevalens]ADO77313.1 Type II site-specific deoxyribonuclease [Halanaerobium praevalens DSM 2228]